MGSRGKLESFAQMLQVIPESKNAIVMKTVTGILGGG